MIALNAKEIEDIMKTMMNEGHKRHKDQAKNSVMEKIQIKMLGKIWRQYAGQEQEGEKKDGRPGSSTDGLRNNQGQQQQSSAAAQQPQSSAAAQQPSSQPKDEDKEDLAISEYETKKKKAMDRLIKLAKANGREILINDNDYFRDWQHNEEGEWK